MKRIILLDAKTLGSDLDLSPLDAFGEVIRYETTQPDQTLNPLLHLTHPRRRLLVTPHIAWASIEASGRLLQGIVANIEAFEKGV